MKVLFKIMVQIKQKRGIGVENPSLRSFSGGYKQNKYHCDRERTQTRQFRKVNPRVLPRRRQPVRCQCMPYRRALFGEVWDRCPVLVTWGVGGGYNQGHYGKQHQSSFPRGVGIEERVF